jgi:predicted dithiol-disulfide oxidoreductase (DUF899 family)
MDSTIARPPVVDAAEWEAALDAQIVEEKEHMRAGDAIAAQRRRLPMVKIEKDYAFTGEQGEVSLTDLFEGRTQLVVYHFMLAPGGDPCPGCSKFTDYLPNNFAHIHDRDITFALVSLAPLPELLAVKERMEWNVPWCSSYGSEFNRDFGRTGENGGEIFGLSVFLRDGDDVFRTYFTDGRGVEAINLIDLAPYGRQEEWEDSPEGWPQQPTYGHGGFHDELPEHPSAPSAQ